jgi:hypothetical protein
MKFLTASKGEFIYGIKYDNKYHYGFVDFRPIEKIVVDFVRQRQVPLGIGLGINASVRYKYGQITLPKNTPENLKFYPAEKGDDDIRSIHRRIFIQDSILTAIVLVLYTAMLFCMCSIAVTILGSLFLITYDALFMPKYKPY